MSGLLSMFQSSIRMMLPLLFASLGVMLSSRIGFINMSMEGGMLSSAFIAVAVDLKTGSPWLGLLAAIVCGIIYFMLLGVLVVNFRGNHVVCSLGLNMVASGGTIVLMSAVFGATGYSPQVEKLPQMNLPVLGQQSVSIFIAIAVTAAILWFLRKTNFGLRVNAIGENTSAADSLGIPVTKYKFIIMILTGILAGLGGSELAIGQMGFFAKGMTSSKGFLAYSAVVFAGFRPTVTILTTFILAFFEALQMRAQTFTSMPSEFLLTLPYVVTIVALIITNNKRKPAMLGRIYERDKE